MNPTPRDYYLYQLHSVHQWPYQQIAQWQHLNVDSVRSRVNRARRALEEQPLNVTPLYDVNEMQARIDQLEAENAALKAAKDPFRHRLGTPWTLNGDWIIVGDIQLSTTSRRFAQRPLEIAKRYLKKPRRALICGDFWNADAFSDYESDVPTPSFAQEKEAASEFLAAYLDVFDEIWCFVGNHERRVGRKNKGDIQSIDLIQLLAMTPRVKVSHWGHALIESPTGVWRATHGSEYSVNQLVKGDALAQKYKTHIISHHQHHLALGWDRYKRYVIIDNGGLFLEEDMGYVVLDDSTRPRMINGFTLLRDGCPDVFGPPPFTNWARWLSKAQIDRELVGRTA